MTLVIRPFVRGQDEPVWVDISSRAWKEDEDFTPETVEELKRWADAPWVGARTRLIAELEGVPVARVNAETEKALGRQEGLSRRPGRGDGTSPQANRHRARPAGPRKPPRGRDGHRRNLQLRQLSTEGLPWLAGFQDRAPVLPDARQSCVSSRRGR